MKPSKKTRSTLKERKTNLTGPPPDGDTSLPFERDETPDPERRDGSETTGPREVIGQAARDIDRGLRDTDLHGAPSNVPGPGSAPENTPGADVVDVSAGEAGGSAAAPRKKGPGE